MMGLSAAEAAEARARELGLDLKRRSDRALAFAFREELMAINAGGFSADVLQPSRAKVLRRHGLIWSPRRPYPRRMEVTVYGLELLRELEAEGSQQTVLYASLQILL